MNNFGEQINLIINNIAEKLGVAVNNLYPALRKQALIDGITGSIWLLLAVILIVVILIKVIKWFTPIENCCGETEVSGVNAVKISIGICVVIISILIIAFDFNSVMTAIFNPDWYIVNKILTEIK